MMYLDHGATSMEKPPQVARAMAWAIRHCGNPGRSGHVPSMTAARTVYACRERAGELFQCPPEQVVFTSNCTHGLNLAIASVVAPGSRVLISGFEHNAVTRPLTAMGVQTVVAGKRLFDWDDTLEDFARGLKSGVSAAVFTHCSNVFGYILPVQQMADLCRQYGVPFVVDAAQSAGILPVSLEKWGADFIAMPGHKGLLGPQGTGILLCNRPVKPLLFGGTGSDSQNQQMPRELPDALEAGTLNVPGIAGLEAALAYLQKIPPGEIFRKEQEAASYCAREMNRMGLQVFSGPHQGGTLSFLGEGDCEELAQALSQRGVAVRAGLHCAPLAHESAGTLRTGTVRLSFGHNACKKQAEGFLKILRNLLPR